MPTHSDAQKYLDQSRQAYVVGKKPVAERKSTKFLANTFRFGFVAVLLFSGYKFATHNQESSPESFSVPSSSAAAVALQKTNQTNRSEERWEIATSADLANNLTDPVNKAKASAPSQNADLVLLENEAALTSLDSAAPEKYKLPIELSAKDTHASIVMKLYRKDHLFEATTIQAEGIETKPYYIEGDSTQVTIGAGYNIKMSATAIGRAGVRKELSRAGISPQNIDLLMNPNRHISEQARITKHQAIALLDIVTKRFENSARSAVGADVFNKLPKHRQAALMMIDYNSNLHNRGDIVAAVRSGNNLAAIEEMETYGRVNGRKQRLAGPSLAQTMFYSKDGAHQAVMNPSQVKRNVLSGNALWDNTAPKKSSQKQSVPVQHSAPIEQAEPETHAPEERSPRLSSSGFKNMLAKMRGQQPSSSPEVPQSQAADHQVQSPDTSFLNGANVRRVK